MNYCYWHVYWHIQYYTCLLFKLCAWRKDIWPSIHKDVLPVYEENCLPPKIVTAGLTDSHRDIHNWKTDRPGHPVEVVTGVAVSQLEVMVRVDRCVRLSNAVDTFGFDIHVSVHR